MENTEETNSKKLNNKNILEEGVGNVFPTPYFFMYVTYSGLLRAGYSTVEILSRLLNPIYRIDETSLSLEKQFLLFITKINAINERSLLDSIIAGTQSTHPIQRERATLLATVFVRDRISLAFSLIEDRYRARLDIVVLMAEAVHRITEFPTSGRCFKDWLREDIVLQYRPEGWLPDLWENCWIGGETDLA